MATDVKIKQVNEALQNYYKSMNQGTRYVDDNNVGKFKQFCDDNGYIDEDIEDELFNNDPDDCLLVGMDMDPNDDDNNLFPLKDDIPDNQRNEAVYNIIKYCFDNGKAPIDTAVFDMKTINLNIDDNVKNNIQSMYAKQLPLLGADYKQELSLMHWTVVGYANNVPLLSLMVDCYTEDKIKHFLKEKTFLTVTEWCRDSGNAIMKYIRKKNKQHAIDLENAIKNYSNRITSGIQFTQFTKVDDNIEDIADYIVAIPSFINKIIVADKILPPFQLDLLIAVRDIINYNNDNTVDDDDDDDDDDDISANDNDDNKSATSDYIGDVSTKLNGLAYFKQNVSKDKLKSNSVRYLNNDFYQKGFKQSLKKQYHDDVTFDLNVYPSKRRFCIFVDRRNPNNDEMTFFEPPKNCRTLPSNNIPEWYFESNRQCLIPGKNDNDAITSETVGGRLMTFSFHVFEKELIKCYVNWNGQTMRFQGDYLKTILPLLFVNSDANKIYVNSNQQINFQVKDEIFKKFYAATKMKLYN